MICLLLTVVLGCCPQCHLGEYFSKYRHPVGITQDRASNPEIFSVAAAGYSMPVIAKTESKPVALRMIRETLAFYTKTNPARNRGWLYHFHDSRGSPVFNKEVSSIDTAIFYSCALRAADILRDADLKAEIAAVVARIDTKWMIDNSSSGRMFSHGFIWEGEKAVFFGSEWDECNEGVILHKLFGIPYEPTVVRYDLPLFVFYYPLSIYPDDKEIQTRLKAAIEFQVEKYGHIVTAVDTAEGYRAFPLEYASPLAEYALGLNHVDFKTHSKTKGWISTDRVGIDEGAAFLLLSNQNQ